MAEETNVPEAIATILVNRGIDTFEKAREYFRPNLGHLHNPLLMDDMEQAVSRVVRAREAHEKILICGDYDVDGTSGSAMLYLFLKKLGLDVLLHIPDRIKEGYGLSMTGIDRGKEFGATVLVAVDCGITGLDQIAYAVSLGFDVIVCDHHEPGERLPPAYAVLDPLKPSCSYPFKSLCGCGVAFKLMQGVCGQLKDAPPAEEYLDFVAVATSADIVPLTGENRTLTKLGLDLIDTEPRSGIRALIESAGLKPGTISTGQIVFMIGPRINAVGRLGDAMRAVNLLTCEDETVASELALVLEEENRNRRKIDEETFLKAQELVDNSVDLQGQVLDGAIVLHHESWHPGVIGIVASRLVEKYYRPTIMMTTVDGVAKGSARSVEGFDIYRALKRCEDKMIQFGGHKHAAGLAVAVDRIDEFRDAFNTVVLEELSEIQRTPEIRIDAQIALREVTPRFVRILKQFAPFGPKNPRPIFLAENVEVTGTPRIVGTDHLRFKVREGVLTFDAIGFNLGHFIDRVQTRQKDLTILFSDDESDWRRSSGELPVASRERETVPQLKIRDLK